MSSFGTPRFIGGSLKAGADLSASIYKSVRLNGAGDVILNIANNRGIGFLMNAPQLGEPAEVASIGGGALARCGNTFGSAGIPLKSDANGDLVSIAVPNDVAIAIAMQPASTGDQFWVEPILYVSPV